MAEPLLLTYNLKNETATALRDLCREQRIRIREVGPREYGTPIGALAGIPVRPTGEPPVRPRFDDEMLVMCHFLSDQMDGFLQGMRARGVPRIALKAVMTPWNAVWDSSALRDELVREHEAIVRRSR